MNKKKVPLNRFLKQKHTITTPDNWTCLAHLILQILQIE